MPSPAMPAGYYNRYTDAQNYDEHLFIAGPALQSAEVNEIQSRASSRLKSVADAIFRDGDIIRDAVVTVDSGTGVTTCSSGAVYLRGAVRGVPSASLTIPVGTVDIGIYLVETVVDATIDATLKDPASGLLNYQRAGAARLKVDPVWGYSGDGNGGDFFPLYTADDRVLRPKQPPPTIDAVAQAIAKYDRDSTGGSYVVSGMAVTALADSGANQVYSVAEGVARANGNDIEFATSRRITFNPVADLKHITNEPHTSTGTGSQRVNVSFTPIADIQSISITKQATDTITHGAFAGCSDALPHTSVLSIVSVVQGGTTYVATTDYKLTNNAVDWSPAGAEPATGSTYQVTYQYIDTVAADSSDDTGFNVTGAVAGTLILVSYDQKMPRIDRICLDENGTLVWLKGVATNYNPRAPIVPSNMLGLASIQQTWLTSRTVLNDGVKVVPMADIARLNTRIDYVLGLVAQARLENSAAVRATGVIKGILTDPFLDDSYRDAGTAQTAAIVDGILTLPIDVTASEVDTRPGGTSTALNHDPIVVIAQAARTGSQIINPHNAFPTPTVPPVVVIWPRIHRWTVVTEVFKSRRTRLMTDLWRWWAPGRLQGNQRYGNFGGNWNTPDQNTQEVTAVDAPPASTLEQNVISFQLDHFSVGEVLDTLTFDGVTVVATVSGPADGTGRITGTFTIPSGIPAGIKEVVFIGHLGKRCKIKYIADGTTVIDPDSAANGHDDNVISPIAETFTLDNSQHLTAVDLWFAATGTSSVEVQIRPTSNGVPTSTVLARARLAPGSLLTTGGNTRFTFDAPIFAIGGVEYAIVVLCDDQTTAVEIAELGKQDPNTLQWVTAQPYQVGVMLTSPDGQTWKAQQDRDLSFQLIGPNFNETSHTVVLGSAAVTNATDLAVRATVVRPTDDADVHFILTLPDASQITVGVDQSVKLDSAITGNVAVQAVLTGTATISPILLPDVQLLWGVLEGSGTYVSRSIAGGTGIKATIVLEAYLPGSSSLTVEYESDGGAYTALTGPSAVQMGDGWVELTYQSGTITNTVMACRLTLSGGTSDRPGVRNLRFFSE